MYDSEVMCRKEVDAPWSIYRDFTVVYKHMKIENKKVKQSDLINHVFFKFLLYKSNKAIFKLHHTYMFYIPFCRKFHDEIK